MANKKKRRKKRRGGISLFPILLVVIVLAAIGAVVFQAANYLNRPATTAIVQDSAIGNVYNGTLVIARDETLYEAENATSVEFVANEGSRVNRSAVICRVYSSGYNQTEITKLNTARDAIESYHVNQVMSTYVDAALDSTNEEIANLSKQVRTLVQGRSTGSLSNMERQLESALSARKSYLKQKYPDDQTLAELYKVENDQLKKIESWTTTYTATGDCLVSFYTDGYERTVNARSYNTMTPADVRNVIRGVPPEQSIVSKGSDPIFRTVQEDVWYALFLCQDREWNPVVGETYRIALTGFDHYVVEGVVQSFSRIGADLLLRLQVNMSVEPVLNIRTCGASIGDFVSGYHVPMSALYTVNDSLGVVVMDGGVQTFVPVTVISYPDSNTAFVRPTLDGSPLTAGKTIMLF